MKFSLTLILSSLMLFLASCSTSTVKKTDSTFLNIKLQTSNKNKEIILEHLLEQDFNFSVEFNIENSYKLNNNIVSSNLKYFCNSFIQDQNMHLETLIFDSTRNNKKKILIIYSKNYEKDASKIRNKYPNELYFYLDREDYEYRIREILGVNNSFNKNTQILSFDKSLKIEHSPRIRNDISKIYYLLDYDFGKTVVPIVRNYAFEIDSYSSSEIFHDASNVKKLVDFENLYIPLSDEMLEKIKKNKNIKSIENELEKLLIEDLVLIEKVYQNNLFRKNLMLNTSTQRIQNNNKCIKRNLSISRISSNELSSLP
tara:strand:- start:1163 stop:2101 length:939 start_codon:yes stop_codon:yes gene_type:complete